MIKNIIIVILVALLIWVWYGFIKPNQIASLWNEIKESWKKLIDSNTELFKEGSDKVTIWELLSQNASILKNYWMNNIDILLKEDNWEESLKIQLLQKILIDSWYKTKEELSWSAKIAYEKWLLEIEEIKNK